MVNISKTAIGGFGAAIRGMRNPLDSWNQGDSYLDEYGGVVVGNKDLDLMKRLTKAGNEHRKFLRFIDVWVDISGPLYWWKEMDTYRFKECNSCSTMHKITSKEFTMDDFSTEHLNQGSLLVMNHIIGTLNDVRSDYLESKDKEDWWQLIQLLPTSYNQKRTLKFTYETLLAMYFQRRNHKLDEWHDICSWIESLPYMSELIKVLDEKK